MEKRITTKKQFIEMYNAEEESDDFMSRTDKLEKQMGYIQLQLDILTTAVQQLQNIELHGHPEGESSPKKRRKTSGPN